MGPTAWALTRPGSSGVMLPLGRGFPRPEGGLPRLGGRYAYRGMLLVDYVLGLARLGHSRPHTGLFGPKYPRAPIIKGDRELKEQGEVGKPALRHHGGWASDWRTNRVR